MMVSARLPPLDPFMHNAHVALDHHPVFLRFQLYAGRVSAGFHADFLGGTFRGAFHGESSPESSDRFVAPYYPPFDEEYFEWIDLLESIDSAKNTFTMLELGAGYGRWTARGAAAVRQRGLSYRFVAVEAEPTHFQWLRQNLQDNGIDLARCRLVHAAVTAKDGKVCFDAGDPAGSYGRAIGGNTEIDAISLPTLLLPLDRVDLVDIDVQGAELDVLASAAGPLNQKVRRVHLETHSDHLHAEILRYFRRLGWKPHFLFEGDTADDTPWGRINFQGGTQSWLNPLLHSPAEIRGVSLLQNSLARRSLTAGRRALNHVAPIGTVRRHAVAKLISPLLSRYRRDSQDATALPMEYWRPPSP
jgi:FkbM family methyltransferase